MTTEPIIGNRYGFCCDSGIWQLVYIAEACVQFRYLVVRGTSSRWTRKEDLIEITHGQPLPPELCVGRKYLNRNHSVVEIVADLRPFGIEGVFSFIGVLHRKGAKVALTYRIDGRRYAYCEDEEDLVAELVEYKQ